MNADAVVSDIWQCHMCLRSAFYWSSWLDWNETFPSLPHLSTLELHFPMRIANAELRVAQIPADELMHVA